MDYTPYIALWAVCGLISAAIANRRKADVNTGFLMGLLLGPLGVLLALTSKPKLTPPFSGHAATLQSLDHLRADGTLTEAEYEAKKSEVLGRT